MRERQGREKAGVLLLYGGLAPGAVEKAGRPPRTGSLKETRGNVSLAHLPLPYTGLGLTQGVFASFTSGLSWSVLTALR